VPRLLALYLQPQLVCESTGAPKLLEIDTGVAWAPLDDKRFTFAAGVDGTYDIPNGRARTLYYGAVQVEF